MVKRINYHYYNGVRVPKITGAGGGKGAGKVSQNSLFATDILYLTTALGEGPIYWINPNGPQDIQIQDSAIDDLINIRGNGLENTDKFLTVSSTGTITQNPLPLFGDEIVSPQVFASPVTLKKGNIDSVPSSSITLQETSASDWDALRFSFIIEELYKATSRGAVKAHTLEYVIEIYDSIGSSLLLSQTKRLNEKTDTAYKFSHKIEIPAEYKSTNGYRFSIRKLSDESDDAKLKDTIKITGWEEIKYKKQAYPRTALIGYALKAVDEHTGGVPNFTSLIKGLLVKVPANYNQPTLESGQIDWRQVEVGHIARTTYGYYLQKTGSSVQYEQNPQIYTGTWDGTFVYSWTQNPVWVIYDLLTNTTYGLGIPEDNIDKYRFYQIAMYCDACDASSGRFQGVDAVADGSFRYKPRTLYTKILENQIGLTEGTPVKERRFILDVTISDQEPTIDILNKLTATFRGMIIYSGGKVSLAIDMPEEYPSMVFNEAIIKQGTFQISGIKESDTYTGVDVTYVEPTNHFKRETVRLDLADANDGSEVLEVENIAALDLTGVTRRSQAMRLAQYQIASSRYLRRNITFSTSTDAINLSPGDVISVAMQGTGVAYGFGGKISSDSLLSDTNVYLEHYTVPAIAESDIVNNTYPLALRIINNASDRLELYIVSNTDYSISSTDNVSSGTDSVRLKVLSKYNNITKSFTPLTSGFSANSIPTAGDLWTLGEIENPNNYYTNKSGKLFKVNGITRDSTEQELIITATEYISNIYVDSDSFINYEPVAYTDITSPFSIPPTPSFSFTAAPIVNLDGSVTVNGIIQESTDKSGYGQKFQTEYFIAFPEEQITVSNTFVTEPISYVSENIISTSNLIYSTSLVGKNGFTTAVGDIKLLCNSVSINGVGDIELTLEGLSDCVDLNFNMHVLAVNDGSIPSLKGVDYISIPVIEKSTPASSLNFVGYESDVVSISRPIKSYDAANNKIIIENSVGGLATLNSSILNTPFYATINQILANNYYANNIFYVRGTELSFVTEGNITPSAINILELPVKPRFSGEVRLFVDGKLQSLGAYTVNTNKNLSINANISYASSALDSEYRIETDYYTVPTIEIDDTIEVSYANTFTVINSSYDTSSALYNAQLSSNSIFFIQLDATPPLDLSGFAFTNVTDNPVGTLDITNNTYTLFYDYDTYSSNFNLANNYVYSLALSAGYEKIFFADELTVPDLPVGTTILRARNRNTLGRLSPFVERSVTVSPLPIQRVDNLELSESLYREQTGGVAVRVTCSFDHIVGQEVTDYEISYRLSSVDDIGSDDGGTPLTYFNTVKVPAAGAENGKIRFTINNINRGALAESNSVQVRVTPLNKEIRGVTASISKAIIGKTAKPLNILGFTGGQQESLVTLFWQYERVGSELYDLDLKEVVIRRAQGSVSASIDNFLVASEFLTVSAPLGRITAPIDTFGTYTYLARTLDSSGNFSDDVVSTTITTTQPIRSSVVAAYSEDEPSVSFSTITNTNIGEYNYPSFANSTGGLVSNVTPSTVDAANGSSSGWSVGLTSNDLSATANAVYTTQIRDFGQVVTASIAVEVEATQLIQSTYTDQLTVYAELASESSVSANVLVDTDGIGNILGYNTPSLLGRYDSNNRTWMTGDAAGNVWAIWNPGQYIGDTANANSYALIAGLINANAVALGATFYANGIATGTNSLANVTSGASYYLVNLTQYNDTGSSTYAGTLGVVQPKIYIRTTTDNPYYANGNVNSLVFTGSGDGYIPYEVGTKTFRYFQLKYEVTNVNPNEYDFELDRFRYTVNKEQATYSNTVSYSSAPTTVDYSSAQFLTRPTISLTVLDQIGAEANPAIAIITAASNQSVSFKLVASDGSGAYAANSSANVMIIATGV